jgi:hypothetical protein
MCNNAQNKAKLLHFWIKYARRWVKNGQRRAKNGQRRAENDQRWVKDDQRQLTITIVDSENKLRRK